MSDYPAGLPGRAPVPPYAGEGPHSLWHFSEDPSLGVFRPRVPDADPRASEGTSAPRTISDG
jgi:hypothetical protein